MGKDSYWFRHDSTAGRGIRIRKIAHIYTHWGKGIYWDVIEILREQDGYKHPKDESSLQMLSSLIGCSDTTKFINWYKDCIKINLLQEDENYFFSSVLIENMINWEKQKRNGSQPKSQTEAKPKPTDKPNGSIREEEIREEDKNTFNDFRILYGGTKRGNDTEFLHFVKKTKDWSDVLPKLKTAIERQISNREWLSQNNKFVPEWKNLQTWVNKRCWEETIENGEQDKKSSNPSNYSKNPRTDL